MRCEIDQSGKLEQTNTDTIIALYSDRIQFTLKIPRSVKRKIYFSYPKRYKKKLTLRLFSICLYLVLYRRAKSTWNITIDDEYPGHGRDIKNMLSQLMEHQNLNTRIVRIGKKSMAHRIGIQTLNGRLKPNHIVTLSELKRFKLLNERDSR